MSGLPPGWTMSTVGQVGEVSLGRQRAPRYHHGEGMRPYLRVANVFEDRIDTTDVMQMTFSDDEFERYRLQPGDVLLNEGQSPHLLGRPAIYRGQPPDVAFTNSLIRFRALSVVTPQWALAVFRHYMRSRRFMRESRITTNIAHLSATRFSTVEFPVPPVTEQKRIIAAIEEHFSRLDAGVAALERARQNLKRMRAAALQGAVIDALGCTDQRMTPLADLLSAPLANGKSVPDGPDNGFPVLRLTAVRDGWIDVACSKKGAWTAGEAKPYMIRKGDYLVVRGNGSKHLVGRGATVGVDSEVAYPDTLIRLRFDETAVVSKYVALMWNSRTVRNQIEDAARTTAGIYKINQKDLGRVTFPVPPIEDQVRIHASADSALYEVGVLEAQLNAQMQRSYALRSSILAAAFSGRMVTQDASDEPATVLLARIAAERTTSNGRKPRRSLTRSAVYKKVTA